MARTLCAAAFSLALAPVALAPGGQAGYHYSYFKQPRVLSLDSRTVALKAAASADAPTNWDAAGVDAASLTPIGVKGWAYASSPAAGRQDVEVELLVADLADQAALEFVSPVFRDEQGDPILVTADLLVGFGAGVSADDADAILDEVVGGIVLERAFAGLPNVYRVHSLSKNGFTVLGEANALALRPEVRFAEPDLILTARHALIPNDPSFGSLWGIRNTGQSGGTNDMDMDGNEAWDTTTGDATIYVVVLDDGVQQDHPDINQIPGMNFTVSEFGGMGPCDNHGTACAGCVSAKINNSLGVVGIAPECKVASAKFNVANVPCNGQGTFQITWFTSGLIWGRDLGAKVTSNSNTFGESGTITSAYQQTRDAGMLHFVAAGNSNSSTLPYPASLPTVNAVAALNRNGNRASFSNYGVGLDVSAPGQSIMSTDRTGSNGYAGGDYATVDGTSFACPYSAGVAALVYSRNRYLTAAEAEQIIYSTCMDRGAAGYDTTFGWGFINAQAAVAAVPPPPPPPGPFDLAAPADGATATSVTPTLSWTTSSSAYTYELVVDDDPAFLNPEINVTGIVGTFYGVTTPLEQARTYYWQVTARNPVDTIASNPGSASFTTLRDCNGNAIDDATDISGGASSDCNGNLAPDECDLSSAFHLASTNLSPINHGNPQQYLYDALLATGDVSLTFRAFADLNFTSEYIDVELNGAPIGTIFGAGGLDCASPPSVETLVIDAATYNAAVGVAGPATLGMLPSELCTEVCSSATYISVEISHSAVPRSADGNNDQIPDECQNSLIGDMNCDGAVNILDINPMVLALADPIAYAAAYPGCNLNNGDVNDDGAVDVLDINPFVALLGGG
ncbi:Thermophilic serine proteinase precursor [Phycisphaerae bacterium RAS1]|nr:Thermophilic serine proteinase precursor [Phycisphaerae bacterium RAS1]